MTRPADSNRLRGGALAKTLLGILGLFLVLTGCYLGALRYFAPDPATLTAWGSDLDAALAAAAQKGRPVLVKAGSEW